MKNILPVFLFLLQVSGYSQPGSLGNTFSIGGKVVPNFGTIRGFSIEIKIDEKVLT